jgi:hypothetical protein
MFRMTHLTVIPVSTLDLQLPRQLLTLATFRSAIAS